MIFTQQYADQVDRIEPDTQRAGLGTEVMTLGNYANVAISIPIVADATGNLDTVAPFAFELLDVTVQCRATNAGGTVTVKKSASVITDAIVMATTKAVTRAGTIDTANSVFAAGDTIRLTTNGAADRGLVTLFGKRSA